MVRFVVYDKFYVRIKPAEFEHYSTPSVGSVGKEDAGDCESCAEVNRPPRIVVRLRVNAAVEPVHFQSNWIAVAVDRP